MSSTLIHLAQTVYQKSVRLAESMMMPKNTVDNASLTTTHPAKLIKPLVQIGACCKSVAIAHMLNTLAMRALTHPVWKFLNITAPTLPSVCALDNASGNLSELNVPINPRHKSVVNIAQRYGSVQGEILSQGQFLSIAHTAARELLGIPGIRTWFQKANTYEAYVQNIVSAFQKHQAVSVFFNMVFPPAPWQDDQIKSSIQTQHCDEFYEHIALVVDIDLQNQEVKLMHFGKVYIESLLNLWESSKNLAPQRQVEAYQKNPHYLERLSESERTQIIEQAKPALDDLSLFSQSKNVLKHLKPYVPSNLDQAQCEDDIQTTQIPKTSSYLYANELNQGFQGAIVVMAPSWWSYAHVIAQILHHQAQQASRAIEQKLRQWVLVK